ncbi:acetoacetate decarboxylase family protein [Mycobacterium sp. OAE908]|uniref:acetoacetate decarboxylase family protein n=1 Tax=Mycobacterium sp. OAE908 TaxID=2817899 RepID=UPI001AE421BD
MTTIDKEVMEIRGQLDCRTAAVVPVHTPAYPMPSTCHFSDVDMLSFTYRTDAQMAARVVPSMLTLEERPKCTLAFLSYGVSPAGPYREVFQSISCRLDGRRYRYIVHIYVTNEPAMVAGREWLGWPKQLATIRLDDNCDDVLGIITAELARPASVPLAFAQFRPQQRVAMTEGAEVSALNLRIIPSAIAGQPAAIREFIPSTLTPEGGEVWLGEGSLRLTGASDFAPLHLLPVEEMGAAMLIRKTSMTLQAPTETFPF